MLCSPDRELPAGDGWVLELNVALLAALVADNWEGTVAKRADSRYRCGHRSSSWVKLKSPAARPRPGPLPRLDRGVAIGVVASRS